MFRKEIIIMGSLLMIACSQTSKEMPESSADSIEAGINDTGPLSSIADYLGLSHTGEQSISENDVILKIDGLVESPQEMNYSQVLDHQIYSKIVTLNCVEGWSVKMKWEGVSVEDLLNEAGIKETAILVIFHSFDDYRISMVLKDVLDNHMLLAYKVNGEKLPLELGFPFQLVAEGQNGYNWIKGVSEIELE
jgi:DMSO/TMAO reductase YedYZ molybdopterin-dependent catalytic subunit